MRCFIHVLVTQGRWLLHSTLWLATSLTLKQAQCALSPTQGCNIFLTLLALQLAMRKGVVTGVSSGIQDFELHEPQPGPCVHLLHLNPLWVPCLFYSPHRFQYSASDFKRLKKQERCNEIGSGMSTQSLESKRSLRSTFTRFKSSCNPSSR